MDVYQTDPDAHLGRIALPARRGAHADAVRALVSPQLRAQRRPAKRVRAAAAPSVTAAVSKAGLFSGTSSAASAPALTVHCGSALPSAQKVRAARFAALQLQF
eukprot:6195832-Pleurochrysis_carterae.AAC.2